MNRNGEDNINTFFYVNMMTPVIRFNSQPCRSKILQSALPETAFIAIFQPTVSPGQVLLVR